MSSKNAAAARRDEIIAENINFMYGRSKENAAADSDKRSFVKSNKFINPFDTISDFTGTNNFLLPSYPTDAFLPNEAEAYPSYEHALQASRFSNVEERDMIRKTELIRDVKKMTPKFKSNRGEDWKKNCLSIAERLLRDKFIRSKELTSKLKGTGSKSLVYANSYGEHFWGSPVDNHSKGQNHLGKLLEKIRNDVGKGEDIDLWLTNQLTLISQSEVEIKVVVEKLGEIVETDGQTFERRPKLFIGKADQNDIVTAHSSTSRTHAALVVGTLQDSTGSKTFVVDFLSANGTFVDGVRIAAYVFVPVTKESLVTMGASSRSYRFFVDTEKHLLAKKLLYDRLANPDILTAKAEEQNNENTVFVGNIPFEAKEADVREFFAVCGAILSVHMPQDAAKSGEHRGIAFVTFSSSTGLIQALSRGGDDLMGRNVAVKRKEARTSANDANANGSKNRVQNEKPSHYTGSNTASVKESNPNAENPHSSSSSFSSSSTAAGAVRSDRSDRSSVQQSKDDRQPDRHNSSSSPRDRKHDDRRSRSREKTRSDNSERENQRSREQSKPHTDSSRASRRRSRSSSPKSGSARNNDRDRNSERNRERDRDRDRSSDRNRDRDRDSDKNRDRDRSRDRDRGRDRDRSRGR